jgi:NtrC-family two-component system sensor histidine kinase KinB
MAVSVGNKIRLGTAFLFLLLLLTGGAGIYFTITLKNEARAVLQDNYESVSYCHIMQQQLDSLDINYSRAVAQFDSALRLEERNITEPGEGKTASVVRNAFTKLSKGDTSKQNIIVVEKAIQNTLSVNMQAIQKKNDKAQRTAERAMHIILGLVGVVFLIAFTFSVNFPSIVTSPIREFLNAIKAISEKNYRYRIRIPNKDEFGVLANAVNNMAERLEYFESSNLNRLMFEKNRAEAVINSLKDASIGIDGDNNILFANHQALQLLGLRQEEAVGKKVAALSAQNDLFRFLMESESSAPFKIVVDNRENYFIKELVDVPQGESNSRVIVLKNITPFKELDVAKTNFIATISHELKTPLAASDFSLKLLEDERIGKLSEEQKELIQSLKQDNRRVLKILSELLSMSQVETGRIQLDVQQVNPYLIVDNAIETIAATAKERNINIRKELQEELPLVQADAEKTTWVLNNFLTNAIKYSKEGGEIVILASKQDSVVTFSVRDNGPGIAQEYHSRLFERYFQVPGAIAKGSGLGLGISKEFIEAQKGKIWVDSEIGQGSTFNFSLPAK